MNGGPQPPVPPEQLAAQMLSNPTPMDVPTLPPFIEVAAPPPDSAFQEIAKKYVSSFCRASRNFTKQKEPVWKLLKDLYENRIGLREWRYRVSQIGYYASSKSRRNLPEPKDWDNDGGWSDFVYTPSYFIDQYANNAYPQIFDGPEWLTVIAEELPPKRKEDPLNPQMPAMMGMAGPGMPSPQQPGMMPMASPGMSQPGMAPQGQEMSPSMADPSQTMPTAQKIQGLVVNRLGDGQVEQRMYEGLQSCATYGSVYAQIFPYQVKTTRYAEGTGTVPEYPEGQQIELEEEVATYPIVQVLALDKVLVDPLATHNDLQRWRGIGHLLDRTYDQIIADFESGLYNLNREEFETRFSTGEGRAMGVNSDSLDYDPDAEIDPDVDTWLRVWVWYGRVPTPTGFKECTCALVTEREIDDPTDGCMIRLTTAALFDTARPRPFCCAHFVPRRGPYGMGLIEQNQDILYLISQLINQFQDNVRMTAVGAMQAVEGLPAWNYLTEKGTIHPLDLIPVATLNGELAPVKMPDFKAQEILAEIKWLHELLEKRTMTDTYLGRAQPKTATGSQIAQQQSSRPTVTITDLFARNFIQPMAQIALAILKETVLVEEVFTYRDANGQDVPLVITPEELREGKYRVVCTLTHQDQTRIARAQQIGELLQELPQIEQHLNMEGFKVSVAELMKRRIDLIGIDGSDRIISRIGTQEQMMMQQIQQLSMQNQQLMQALQQAQQQPQQVPEHSHTSTDTPPAQPQGGNGDVGPGPMGDEPTDANYLAQIYQEATRPGAQT